MTRLPRDVPAKKVIAALERIGFRVSRVSGSHYIMVKDELRTVVPYHKAVKIGTLKSILNQVGIEVDEFLDLMK
ncbi:MAG: type II toxin-antitoxin system HicA family toxin [Pyrinomonadaceae bacterium]